MLHSSVCGRDKHSRRIIRAAIDDVRLVSCACHVRSSARAAQVNAHAWDKGLDGEEARSSR